MFDITLRMSSGSSSSASSTSRSKATAPSSITDVSPPRTRCPDAAPAPAVRSWPRQKNTRTRFPHRHGERRGHSEPPRGPCPPTELALSTAKLSPRTSPANRLRSQRGNFAVLVDGHHVSLLSALPPDPAQREVQPVPAHDHGLGRAPRLNPKALFRALCDVRVQRGRTRIWLLATHHSSIRASETDGFGAVTGSTRVLLPRPGPRLPGS